MSGLGDDGPRELVVGHDGLRIGVLDWGGDGEPLLLLHPNGFCAGLFDPLARRIADRYRPIGVDLRAHGRTDVPPDPATDYAFALMAADVLAVLDALGVEQVAALGESLGGGVATLVDAARPGILRRLVLCEAIAFDPRVIGAPRLATNRTGEAGSAGSPDEAALAPPTKGAGENFMAKAARKRRAVWPDRATVRDSYGSRPPLDELAPEALDAYVRWGFVDRADGQVELACPPDAEATIFEESSDERGALAAWRRLDSLHAPTVVLHGTASNLPAPWFEAQAERIGTAPIAIEGGHLFLQEDTARAEALVREHLS